MDLSAFIRTFSVRSERIMWLLGAGASASAGIKTAWDMIWDFKRTLYCSNQRIPVTHVQNLNDERVRGRLQLYFDGLSGYPSEDSPEEYAFYFEAAHPSASDRQQYIENLVREGTPSYGHLVLAALMRMEKAKVVWTTNFDRMVEDALYPILPSSGDLVIADIERAGVGTDALLNHRFPLYVKLHGDFLSRRLKNTGDELKQQDQEHRRNLVDACRRFGLAVVGYSGRDDSIMSALEEAIDGGRGYPAGLFWFNRGGSPVFPRVSRLIDQAREAGIGAHVIESETFDELMGDLLTLLPQDEWPEKVRNHINEQRPRLTNAPISPPAGGWPVLRFNALRVHQWPATCRLVECGVGGTKEVKEAVKAAEADVIATRRKVGVLAFGSDAEIDKAFGAFKIKRRDLYTIQEWHLKTSYSEHEMLYEALVRALSRECGVRAERKGSDRYIVADLTRQNSPEYRDLKKAARTLGGTISGTKVQWAHAALIHLTYQDGRLWLLLEPHIWAERQPGEQMPDEVKEFQRQKKAGLYNQQWNELLEGWASLLVGRAPTRTIRAFGIGDGVDASFTIGATTAFSHRRP